MASAAKAQMNFYPNIGAVHLGGGRCRFRTWAPYARKMEVRLLSPEERTIPMVWEQRGYWSVETDGVPPGTRYFVRIDEKTDRPDPASFSQPEGVHGPSEVIDLDFAWHDGDWTGPLLRDYIFYEIHVGTFTEEGTFDALARKLDHLVDLGVTSIEIMPVAQFSGARNWGYDGAFPFAVQNSYGGPDGLRRLIDGCHGKGLAVTLDVVYNHLGPEGNYLRDFGPYFTQRYLTPWGEAMNFDGPESDEVRNYFIQNALFWFRVYHVDALRLDAVHAVFDRSAVPFLEELASETARHAGHSKKYLVAESDLNDSRILRPKEAWGCGLDAQWSDDFHHALHALLTGERAGYYRDFGPLSRLLKAFREGYVYSGNYSEFRQRRHGNFSADLQSEKFVVAAQNHDQVGNRMLGERLSTLVSFEAAKTAAAALLLSPFVPLLFMGQEYGEEAPFLYFVSHSDPKLIQAVRRGRSEEFSAFSWEGEIPDPQKKETFLRSRLDWKLKETGSHRLMLDFHKELIRLRKTHPALIERDGKNMEVNGVEEKKIMAVKRRSGEAALLCLFNFDSTDHLFKLEEAAPDAGFNKVLDSADTAWGGPGSLLPERAAGGEPLTVRATSAAVFSKD